MGQETTHPEKAAFGYFARARRKLATEATRFLFQRQITVTTSIPLISFTFDDFPRSAFHEAGSTLKRHGVEGTFYASLGLLGKQSPMGPMYEAEDLKELVHLGHELGCHTFGHCHSWNTPPDVYERAILENRQALAEVLPEASFQTFAYPHSAPRLAVKKVPEALPMLPRRGAEGGARSASSCCRRPTFNSGVADLNYLCAFFLEQSRDNLDAVKSLITQNAGAQGWLIFATHDVCANPSPFGCTPDVFERVVQWSLDSGARILPVVKALDVIQSGVRK